MMNLFDMLIKHGYKKYDSYKDEIIFFQKKFSGTVVCDCNHANYIDVEIFISKVFSFNPQITIGLRAEKKGKWWDIKCYGIPEKEFIKSIAVLEKKIIKAFGAIAGK